MVLSNSFLRAQFTYMIFVYLNSLLHYFTGLLRANIMTSPQSWLVSSPVSQTSRVQNPYALNSFLKPQFTYMEFI